MDCTFVESENHLGTLGFSHLQAELASRDPEVR